MHRRQLLGRVSILIATSVLCLSLLPRAAWAADPPHSQDPMSPDVRPAQGRNPVHLTGPAADWEISVLDSAGNVGLYTSIALDKDGYAHVSYIDGTRNMLKYATNRSGTWVSSDVRAISGTPPTSIAVDSKGKVYIGFVLWQSWGSYIMVAVRDLTGGWSFESGGEGQHDTANGVSVAVDRSDVAHVAGTVGDRGYSLWSYKVEYLNNSTGSFKLVQFLPTFVTGAITLRAPSLAIDSGNNVHVAFDVSGHLARATNRGGTWAASLLSLSATGPIGDSNRYLAIKSTGQAVAAVIAGTENMALALDRQDKSHIVGHQNGCLRYFTDVDGSLRSYGLDCSSPDVGEYGAVAVDDGGGIHISYFDRTNGDLKYARQTAVPPLHHTYAPLVAN